MHDNLYSMSFLIILREVKHSFMVEIDKRKQKFLSQTWPSCPVFCDASDMDQGAARTSTDAYLPVPKAGTWQALGLTNLISALQQ